MITTILVPIDFSEHSRKAEDTAIGLAKTLGARIHLTHVLHYPVQFTAPSDLSIPQSLWTQVREGAERELREAAARVTAAGLSVGTHIVEGPNAQAIVELADKLAADLIVMGTRGLSGLKHVMLGSVAERTVRLANCPVMTVKEDVS